jgi:hypothetical protein
MHFCKLEGKADIFKRVFAEHTKEKLQNCCSHVKKTEKYWQRDGLMEEASDSMIIYIGESSDNISTGEGQLWSLSEDE